MINRTQIPDSLMGLLLNQVTAAGYSMWEEQDGWHSNADAAVQAIIDGFAASLTTNALPAALALKKDEIARHAANLRQQALQAAQPFAGPAEMASWPTKSAQARQYLATLDESVAPLIVAEAQYRQTSVDTIAQRVAANADALEALEAQIAGTAGRHRDLLDAIAATPNPTSAEVEAIAGYDFSAGWPQI